MTSPRIIKKYSNRRLYDTTISKSITLDEVKTLVLQRIPFKVIDNTSEEDMTNYVLLQIITEGESGQSPIFTTDILENIIRIYDNPMQKSISEFLAKSFALVNEQKHSAFDELAAMTKRNMAIWQSLFQAPEKPKDSPQSRHKKS